VFFFFFFSKSQIFLYIHPFSEGVKNIEENNNGEGKGNYILMLKGVEEG